MADIKHLLRQGDPAEGAALDAHERDHMRRRVIEALPDSHRRHPALVPALVMGLVMVVVAGTWLAYPTPRITVPPNSQAGFDTRPPVVDDAPRRQLQFATPGGTRVIWTFDSSAEVR